MQEMPYWALALTYWLHLLATVIWIGSLSALAFIVLPAASRVLEPAARLALLDLVQKRIEAISGFSLVLLVATGMFQLSASPNYEGLLALNNRWAVAIFIKHLTVIGMAVAGAVMSWGILPAIRRATLRYQRSGDEGELAALRRREKLLLRVNILLAVIVLAMTALASAA